MSRALVLILIVGASILAACAVPAAPSGPGRIGVINAAHGAPFYSDDELSALLLKVVTDADFNAFPLPAVRLAPDTQVEVFTETHTIDLKGTIAPYPMVFERLRVRDGPAKGRVGWIQAGWATTSP